MNQRPSSPFTDPYAGGQLVDELAAGQPNPEPEPHATVDGMCWDYDANTGTYHSTEPVSSNAQLRQLIKAADGDTVTLDMNGYAELRVPGVPSSAGRLHSTRSSVRPAGELTQPQESEVDRLVNEIEKNREVN